METYFIKYRFHVYTEKPLKRYRSCPFWSYCVDDDTGMCEITLPSIAKRKIYGKWIEDDRSMVYSVRYCSECGHVISAEGARPEKCDGCGARMERRKMIRKEPPEESMQQTVIQMLNDIAAEICDDYCKYADGIEKEEELAEHCWECPLNSLGN